MIRLIVILCFFGLTQLKQIDLPSSYSIDLINSLNTTWKAGRNFDGTSLRYVSSLVGTLQEPKDSIRSRFKEVTEIDNSIELPDKFDARDAWPECESIGLIRDQGNCGSCWAVSTVSVMSDRLCIKSNGSINVQLSTEEVLSCCGSICGLGCRGGYAKKAYAYWKDYGIVSGGLYKGGGCLPYSVPPCEHHINGSKPLCEQLGVAVTSSCTRECVSGYEGQNFTSDKHFGSNVYKVKGTEQIMKEILTNGPVSAQMEVFDDLLHYKSGVYHHIIGESHGYHTVKIVGWGIEQEVDYWLIANSWNSDWGDNGFFKLRRGTGECKIESSILTALPVL